MRTTRDTSSIEAFRHRLDAADAVVRPVVRRTPMLFSHRLSDELGCPIYLKCENRQATGSFKVRGALNSLSLLDETRRKKGVSTISAGNHAQAVAWVAQRAGVPALVVMPEHASALKVERTRRLGAEVVLHGSASEAFERVGELTLERGLTFLHPFDDEDVVCGHGTCGREILEELPGVGNIVVPVGGGGLASGVALAAALDGAGVRVWGVEPVAAASMHRSLATGRPTSVTNPVSVADGLAAPMAGALNHQILDRLGVSVSLVTEAEIVSAVLFLFERERLVVEPAGAAGVAALLAGKLEIERPAPAAVILTGGNIDPRSLAGLVDLHGPNSRA